MSIKLYLTALVPYDLTLVISLSHAANHFSCSREGWLFGSSVVLKTQLLFTVEFSSSLHATDTRTVSVIFALLIPEAHISNFDCLSRGHTYET